MLIIKSKFKINLLIIISFVILSFISIILLLNSKVVYPGWDTQFHFRRIIELHNLISHFNLLANFSFNEFHGSSVLVLYPYLNLLPSIFLSFIIKSKLNLIYGIFMFNTLLTFIISFYSCKSYIKNYSISYMFSIIYGLLNTFLGYYFIVGDFGVIYSYIFLPIIIFNFLRIFKGDNSWIQLSLGMSLILYSHILNFIIISVFLMIILIININKLNKTIIIKFVKSILLFIIITAIIWFPFFAFYFNNVNNIHIPLMNQLENISFNEFLTGIYGGKSWNTMGTFSIISIFVSFFFYKRFNRYIKQIYSLSLITIFSVLFLPWKFITSYGIFRLLNQIQFTNRFLIIPQIVLIFTLSLIISKYIVNYYIRTLLYYLIIFIVILLQLIPGQYALVKNLSNVPNIHEYYINNKIKNYKINSSNQFNLFLNIYNDEDNDYIPKSSLPVSQYVNHNIGFYDNVHKIRVNHIGYDAFKFSGNNINKISLPIYSYNKEKLHVYLNNRLVNNYADKNGLLTMNNIKHDVKLNNKVYIKPALDPFRITGAILSIFGWLLTLGIIIRRKLLH